MSARFINLAAVADVMKIKAALRQIEFIQNSVIAYSQLELGSAAEPFVGKFFQPRAHVVDFLLNRVSNGFRQCIERLGKCGRPNLEGGRHKLFRLTGRVFPGSDFAPGLVELGFGFVRQFQSILKIIIDPFTDRLDFLAGQLGNRCSDFFNRAHSQNLRWKAFARNDVK